MKRVKFGHFAEKCLKILGKSVILVIVNWKRFQFETKRERKNVTQHFMEE